MHDILLCGKMGSGKSTIANYLEKKYGYYQMHFAAAVKEIATKKFGMKAKDRELLQMIGKVGRALNEDMWVDRLRAQIDYVVPEDKAICIDDCRFRNEFIVLSADYEFVPIFVMAPEDIRINRLMASGQAVSRKYLDDISETDLDTLNTDKYVCIINNSTLAVLYKEVDEMLVKING